MKYIKTFLIGLFLILLSILPIFSQPATEDIETLRHEFIKEALNISIDTTKVQQLIHSFLPDSIWPDINYKDVSREAFEHRNHLSNIVLLSRAYRKDDSPYKGNQQVKQVFDAALGYWVKYNFICENWWWNEIGTPQQMVLILLTMDEELSEEQIQGILPIAGRAHLNAWGARPSGDRIKIAGIQAKVSLFQYDRQAIKEIIKVIEEEIRFSTEKGMKHDYSFHHRTDWVNNTLTYGTDFADAFAEWAAKVADTPYCFSDSSIELLIDYYLDGICKQMVYGKIPDPGVMNREIARHTTGGTFSPLTPERLLKASSYRKEELENIVKARKGEEFRKESFATHFWLSDHFVFQRPSFHTSVRMYSSRNHNMEEPYNGEGITNHYRGDGSNYLNLRGTEYYGLPPVYDWRKIPGTTVLGKETMPHEDELQKPGLTKFAGAVTDGLYGAVGFDFISPHDSVKAKKSWFFFDEGYVCLGTAICSNTVFPVITTINQTLHQTEVLVKYNNELQSISSFNNNIPEKVNWVHHDRVGYLFPESTQIGLNIGIATGSWSQINRQSYSPVEEVRKDIFKLWLDHGNTPRNSSYAYIVLPDCDVSDLNQKMQKTDLVILSNTEECQAVYHTEKGIGYAVCYQPSALAPEGLPSIRINTSGIFMVIYKDGQIEQITVSDPTQMLSETELIITGKNGESENLTIKLPQGPYAGQSITSLINGLPAMKSATF